MRKKRYFMSGAGVLISAGFFILAGSIILAFSNNYTPLPISPSLVLGYGTLGFIVFTVLGAALMWFDTSWATPLHRQQMPYTPDRDTIARVLTSDATKEEYFIYGKPEHAVREVVEKDWPFESKLRSRDWYIVDENGMDVSDRNFNEVEGTLRVVFER